LRRAVAADFSPQAMNCLQPLVALRRFLKHHLELRTQSLRRPVLLASLL
jgi:hypothetical protein